jgi:hypothetical protein
MSDVPQINHRKPIREAALSLHKSASEVGRLPDSSYPHQGAGYRNALSLSLRTMARICEQCAKTHSAAQTKRAMLDAPAPDEYSDSELRGHRDGISGGLNTINRFALGAGITDLNAMQAAE